MAFATASLDAAQSHQEDSLDAYNVLWDSPSADHNGSMPIGNGETGLNLWVEPNGDLLLLISRTDSWDQDHNLLKLGRVRIKFAPALAGGAFKQELKLRQGEIEITGGSGDSAIKARIWVDANRQMIHVDADSTKAFYAQVQLELWRDADTVLGEQNNRIGWYHRNVQSLWGDTLQVQHLQPVKEIQSDPLLHRTFGGLIEGDGLVSVDDRTLKTSKAQNNFRLSILTHTETPATEAQWLQAAEESMREAAKIPLENALASHRNWWAQFWDRSWIYARPLGAQQQDISSIIPANEHDLRIGMDFNGGNRFAGEIGRVSMYKRYLSEQAVQALAASRTKSAGRQGEGVLYQSNDALYTEIDDSASWTDSPEMSFEAWIKPAANGTPGRIIDKVTPGNNAGLLLDTYPGNALRLIIGNEHLSVPDALKSGQWHHVAVTVDSAQGRIDMYLDGQRIKEQVSMEKLSDAESATRAYVLQRWIAACAGRGNFPIKFNGSLFTVNDAENDNPDFRRWGGHYWFQNTRLPYWAMLSSGDFDMMKPLFEMYRQALPLAKMRSQIYSDHEGVFFPETMTFWGTYANDGYGVDGRMDYPGEPTRNPYIRYHYTGTLELLAMLIDTYAYTRDREFLEQYLLPIADECLLWWDQHWEREASGKLQMYPVHSQETYWEVTNATPDVAGLTWTLDRLLEMDDDAIGADRRVRWTRLRTEIPSIPLSEVDGKLAISPAHGEIPEVKNSENPELYAIFPFRLYGLGKPDPEIALTTWQQRKFKGTGGWIQDSIQAALLGLTDEAKDYVIQNAAAKHAESRFPAFWTPNHNQFPDQDHGSVTLIALQRMLMQCDPVIDSEGGEGSIRLLPAWPEEWDVDFKLHAPQNTIVEGRVENGKVIDLKVTPESRRKDVVIMNTGQPTGR
jgi:hypothetical protein